VAPRGSGDGSVLLRNVLAFALAGILVLSLSSAGTKGTSAMATSGDESGRCVECDAWLCNEIVGGCPPSLIGEATCLALGVWWLASAIPPSLTENGCAPTKLKPGLFLFRALSDTWRRRLPNDSRRRATSEVPLVRSEGRGDARWPRKLAGAHSRLWAGDNGVEDLLQTPLCRGVASGHADRSMLSLARLSR
jgi:hypothetical protein